MNSTELKQARKKVERRKENAGNLSSEILNFLVDHREAKMSDMTLEVLAKEMGFAHASSAMRMEKETFKLTLTRFFELCELYNLDPALLIKEMQTKLRYSKK